ncbi:hypothetical protein BV20DRAFT_181363 [Pilatotrama ljubarskyi]|nr:hypothetical protein BV20DRAFT_181363 [Pilatotrama ljubarskyi]
MTLLLQYRLVSSGDPLSSFWVAFATGHSTGSSALQMEDGLWPSLRNSLWLLFRVVCPAFVPRQFQSSARSHMGSDGVPLVLADYTCISHDAHALITRPDKAVVLHVKTVSSLRLGTWILGLR